MKKDIFIALGIIVFVVAAAGWYFVFYKPAHMRSDPMKQSAYIVTANKLIDEFISNQSTANNKYKDQSIEVTGQVKEVHRDSTGTTVLLSAMHPTSGVNCRFKKGDVPTINIGSMATIRGFFKGFLIDVQLAECALIEKEDTPKQKPSTETQPVDTLTTPNEMPNNETPRKEANKSSFTTKTAKLHLFSKNTLENVEAVNNQVVSTIETSTGDVSFLALIKGFRFDNELMQEHFNGAEYMNSDIFPKAEFTGTITNLEQINFEKPGKYKATVEGILKLHGVSRKMQTTGSITIEKEALQVQASFVVSFADFNVKSWDEKAASATISVNARYTLTEN